MISDGQIYKEIASVKKKREGLAWWRFNNAKIVLPDDKNVSHDFNDWDIKNGKKKLYPDKIIVPGDADDTELMHIYSDNIPQIISKIRGIKTDNDILDLVNKWGSLKETQYIYIRNQSPHYIRKYDKVSDWRKLSINIDALLCLKESIDKNDVGKYISREDGLFRFENDIRSLGRSLFHVRYARTEPPFLDYDYYLNAEDKTLAINVIANMLFDSNPQYRKEYGVLSNGQIISFFTPQNLYSFIWQILEATILSDLPSNIDLRMRKCFYCGEWDLQNGERIMRKNRDTGQWYHHECKRRINRRKDLDELAAAQGRKLSIRPGARKNSVFDD